MSLHLGTSWMREFRCGVEGYSDRCPRCVAMVLCQVFIARRKLPAPTLPRETKYKNNVIYILPSVISTFDFIAAVARPLYRFLIIIHLFIGFLWANRAGGQI